MKIIVVDDEMSALQAFLGEVIAEEDVEYKFFRDNVKAILSYVGAGGVSAAFLDVNMPGINGIELAAKLIEIDPALRIVFISGLSLTRDDLPKEVNAATMGFLYKPYDADTLRKYLYIIRDKRRVLHANMFDVFDCFIDGKPVKFYSAKSKELFALLLAYNGKILTMGDAIAQLWPDAEVEKSKILYRDAVWKLRKTLSDIGIDCVDYGRAQLALDKTDISCDYWNYLLTGKGNYRGEFCRRYDWSVNYLAALDKIRGTN